MNRPAALTIATLLAIVLLARPASSDGKVFPLESLAGATQIPDQRALLYFAGGVETLAIDTAFRGDGTEFAWIVPLPSPPRSITPATPGLFPTLEILFRPELHRISWLMGVFLAEALLLVVLATRKRSDRVVAWAGCGCLILIPSLSIGVPAGSPPVTVVDRQTVGAFETTTLTATDAGALVSWLDENGYAAPPGLAAAAATYIAEGWCFVASRLHREAGGSAASGIHPLVFVFDTLAPVYPMVLTGLGATEPLALELFVFAEGRAEVEGMAVEVCAPTIGDDRTLPVKHPALAALVGKAAVATKLRGRFEPEQMRRDLRVDLQPFAPTWRVVYSAGTISGVCVTLVMAAAIASWLAWLWMLRRAPGASFEQLVAWQRRLVVLGLAAALLGAVLPRLLMPSAPTRYQEVARLRAPQVLKRELSAAWSGGEVGDLAALAALAAKVAEDKTNPFTGAAFRLEDSPGNYTLAVAEQGIELIGYDASGAPRVLATFSRLR